MFPELFLFCEMLVNFRKYNLNLIMVNVNISLGLIGLAITYSIQITPILGSLLTIFTVCEKDMVRVERVSQYIEDTPREEERSTDVI